MKSRVLILHGWGGSDYPHWQAILASKIAQNYGTVSFPLIHHPHFPHLNRWRKEILKVFDRFTPDIVVCHSLANTLWLYLSSENLAPHIEKLYMVSPPSLNTKHEMLKSFFPAPMPKSLNADIVKIAVSDNDPWIEVDEAKELAKYYNATLHIVPNGGHINSDSGFGRWSWIEDEVMYG